jgi:hypothetical protein
MLSRQVFNGLSVKLNLGCEWPIIQLVKGFVQVVSHLHVRVEDPLLGKGHALIDTCRSSSGVRKSKILDYNGTIFSHRTVDLRIGDGSMVSDVFGAHAVTFFIFYHHLIVTS